MGDLYFYMSHENKSGYFRVAGNTNCKSLRLLSLPCPYKSELTGQEGWGFTAGEPVQLYVERNETVWGAEVLMKVSPVFLKFGAVDRLPRGGGGDCSISYSKHF